MRRLLAAAALLLAACGGEGPEERLRAVLDAMEQAAEERDLGDFMAHVARDYRDGQGRGWAEVRAIAAREILRNRRLFLLHRVVSLELAGEDRAAAVVLVAMAGQPLEQPGDLPRVEADLYRFEVEFRDRDGWQAVAAGWRPAQLGEFLEFR